MSELGLNNPWNFCKELFAFKITNLEGHLKKWLFNSVWFCVWRNGMEGECIKMNPRHLGRNVYVKPLQGTACFLIELLCSPWASHLKPRSLLIKAWDLFRARNLKQENNLNRCRWAALAGFQHRSLRRWCRATRYVGGHIFGLPDCMPIWRFQ